MLTMQALATANPPLYVTQQETYAFYASHFDLTPETDKLYQRFLLDSPIHGRYVGLDKKEDACETNPDALHDRFLRYARQTAADAARKAMRQADLNPEDIGGLVVNTCTGYCCPGLSSYLAEDLGLSTNIRALDVVGMGCGGALPNVQAAAGLLALHDERPILSIAVEICSATLFMGTDPALIVSNSIFGDGAAAAILQSDKQANGSALLRIIDFASGLYPKHRNELHYRQEGGRLRNVLSRKVPLIGARTSREVLNRLLAEHHLQQQDIAWWAVHAGGTAVLDQVGRDLGLTPEALQFSLHVFHTYGNMSSPSVLFALQQVLEEGCPARGERGILLSFGAGFSSFAALVEFL